MDNWLFRLGKTKKNQSERYDAQIISGQIYYDWFSWTNC